MTWSDFYLICFAVGFFFSFFSFVFGGSRTKLHLPHFHGHAGGHLPTAHGPVGNGAAQGTDSGHVHRGVSISPFNPPSIAAFLAWFGGAGYLLTRFSPMWVGFALSLSVVTGVIGGGIIFLFLSRVLISEEDYLDPADFEMVGVLGKLSMPVREGGTGELIYSQMGTRRVCGARSDGGGVMVKGAEVVVTRYEKGIAYVRLWSEMSGEPSEISSAVP
jgi:hypothetical protein